MRNLFESSQQCFTPWCLLTVFMFVHNNQNLLKSHVLSRRMEVYANFCKNFLLDHISVSLSLFSWFPIQNCKIFLLQHDWARQLFSKQKCHKVNQNINNIAWIEIPTTCYYLYENIYEYVAYHWWIAKYKFPNMSLNFFFKVIWIKNIPYCHPQREVTY